MKEYGKKYCQHDEESIVLNLFDAIGIKSKTLCDIGARMQYSNSRRFLKDGWTGKLIDASSGACDELRKHIPNAEVICAKVTIDNVNDYVDDVDFLSIDVDTYDWWLWAFIKAKPRVVCIEFNKCLKGLSIVDYDPDMQKCNRGVKAWTQNASLDAMVLLGQLKGYRLAATTGVNAIFVLKSEGK